MFTHPALVPWIFVNYASIEIANEELIFFGRGARSNYRQLMGEKADEFGGKGFITEYAAPANELVVMHPFEGVLAALLHLRMVFCGWRPG